LFHLIEGLFVEDRKGGIDEVVFICFGPYESAAAGEISAVHVIGIIQREAALPVYVSIIGGFLFEAYGGEPIVKIAAYITGCCSGPPEQELTVGIDEAFIAVVVSTTPLDGHEGQSIDKRLDLLVLIDGHNSVAEGIENSGPGVGVFAAVVIVFFSNDDITFISIHAPVNGVDDQLAGRNVEQTVAPGSGLHNGFGGTDENNGLEDGWKQGLAGVIDEKGLACFGDDGQAIQKWASLVEGGRYLVLTFGVDVSIQAIFPHSGKAFGKFTGSIINGRYDDLPPCIDVAVFAVLLNGEQGILLGGGAQAGEYDE